LVDALNCKEISAELDQATGYIEAERKGKTTRPKGPKKGGEKRLRISGGFRGKGKKQRRGRKKAPPTLRRGRLKGRVSQRQDGVKYRNELLQEGYNDTFKNNGRSLPQN